MTKNRLVLALLAVSALLLGACNTHIDISFDGNTIDGSGTITTESYDLSGFDKIEVCCPLDIELDVSSGPNESVNITTDDNLHSLMEVSVVDGDTLLIKPKSNRDHLDSAGPIVVRISGFQITALEARAASSVSGTLGDASDVEIRGDAAASSDIKWPSRMS